MDKKENVKLEAKKIKDEQVEREEIGMEADTGREDKSSELIFDDIVSSIKDKQKEFTKLLSDYGAYNKATLMDVIETEDSIIIKADLPRLKKQDIEIAISEDTVDICAELEEETLDQDVNYLKRERSFGEVRRTVKLPSKVRIKEAEGTFKNSVLTIKLPKQVKKTLKLKID